MDKRNELTGDVIYLDGEELLLVGAYLLLIGTFIAAVGETPKDTAFEQMDKKLIRDGNAVQALANTLQGIGRLGVNQHIEHNPNYFLAIIGCFIQAGGNSINSIASNEEIEYASPQISRFNSLGSSVQSMGAAFETAGVFNGKVINLEVLGNILITLGALLDSVGILVPEEKPKQKDILLATGGWSEFIGAAIGAYVISKERSLSN